MNRFRKFFFTTKWEYNLKNLGVEINKFNIAFDKLERSSNKCQSIMMEIKLCELLLEELKTLFRANIDFTATDTQFLNAAFSETRKREYDYVLKDLKLSVYQAARFIFDFHAIRAKKGGDASEFVYKKDQQERDESMRVVALLHENLEKWRMSLEREQPDEAAKTGFLSRLEEGMREAAVQLKPKDEQNNVYLGLLREAIKGNKQELPYYVAIMEDIYLVSRHDVYQQTIQDAKNKGFFGARERLETVKGLQYLGPFGIQSVDREHLNNVNFENAHKTRTYEYRERTDDSEALQGKISKVTKLTVTDPETKSRLKIPKEATHYAFVYPVEKTVVQGDDSDFDAFDLVGKFGGYAYFDDNFKLVGLNGLINDGTDMYFTGPFLLKDPDKWIEKLKSEDRFQDITIEALRREYAKQFCWVMPGEFGYANHGGFVYLYDDDKEWPSTYFEIVKTSHGEGVKQIKDNVNEGNSEVARYLNEYFVAKFYTNKAK